MSSGEHLAVGVWVSVCVVCESACGGVNLSVSMCSLVCDLVCVCLCEVMEGGARRRPSFHIFPSRQMPPEPSPGAETRGGGGGGECQSQERRGRGLSEFLGGLRNRDKVREMTEEQAKTIFKCRPGKGH